jgi:ABC-type branched-subunit amino acid transport system permease subunit
MSYFLSLLNAAAIFGGLAALQALLLNRLGLAFAGMPAFLGLGAYAVVMSQQGPAAPALLVGVAAFAGVGLTSLSGSLRKDHYLLATLATLECLAAIFGTPGRLGGREGLATPAAWTVGGRGFEESMLPWTLSAFFAVIAGSRFLLGTAAGVAVDRIREHPQTAGRWFPDQVIRHTVVAGCLLAATAMGVLYALYYGRVGPNVFSLESAILVLIFTVLGGRSPEVAALSALAYWSLPYFLTMLLPLSERGAADFLRVTWGGLVVATIYFSHRPRVRQSRA